MSEHFPSAEVDAAKATALPTGTLALLFTDIDGSTALLRALGEEYRKHLETHRGILRAAVSAHHGFEVDASGDGFFAVFLSVGEAVAAVVQMQRELQRYAWPLERAVWVRMGLHWGEAELVGDDYIGLDVHRAARLMNAGHGGQVLLSDEAAALSSDLPEGCELRDRGEHRLKDLPHSEPVWELHIEGLKSDFPPLRTLGHRSHNLPAHLRPILGRERDIASVRKVLESGTGLTTLLGPGGTGKTRLALEIAALTLERWENGVFFVPLAPIIAVDDAAAVEDAIAGAVARELGVRDNGSQSVQEQVLEALKTRAMLLVLDNFEHLVVGAQVVSRWLMQCSQLQILATSRVPLRLSGEREVPLAPLSLPVRQPLPEIAELARCASVALFIERAQNVRPEFALNSENAPSIAEICERLDGLPLALELAAAQIKWLPPAAMLARMEKRLSFLVGGPRDTAARQQTLRAAIAWSYDLLSDEEKRVFRRLGVFRGGFGFASAEQVCGAPLESELESENALDIFEGVASLLNQSLLVTRGEVEGEARFGMLETIREFALEQLELCGEGEPLRERHLRWCFKQAAECDARMIYDLARALREFESEADNWRAAWNWSLETRPDEALCLAAESALLWNRIGGTTEHYERLETALRAAPQGDAEHRCRALHFLVQAERNRANRTRYETRLQELEALSQREELLEFQAIALDQRMWDEVGAGDLKTALERCGSIVKLRRLCVERARENALDQDEIERCELELNDAMILQVEILSKAGRFDDAWDLMEESLAMKRASRDESGLTFALYKYAQLLLDSGRVAEARTVSEQVLQRAENSGDRSVMLAWYRYDAAKIALRAGDAPAARAFLRASYAVFKENAAKQGYLDTLYALILLQGLENDWPRVAHSLGATHSMRGKPFFGNWQNRIQEQEDAARAALGETEFAARFVEGAKRDLQQLIEESLMIE